MLAAARQRRRDRLHDRLPDRALALARQPVRLPAAVRLLRACRRTSAPRLLFVGIVAGAGRCAAWRSSAATALIERSTSSSTSSARRCWSWPGACSQGVGEEPATPTRRFARPDGPHGSRRTRSPLTLALMAMVFADIAFAVDSIPAAFAITTDSFVIWTANAFALLGMRALFVLVEGLVERFRYLGQTIAVVLAHRRGQAAHRGPRPDQRAGQPGHRRRRVRRGHRAQPGGRPPRRRRLARAAAEVGDLAPDLVLDVERRLALARAAGVAGDDQRADLGLELRVDAVGAVRRASSASTSSGSSPRAARRALRASSIWRISSSATSRESAAVSGRRPSASRSKRQPAAPDLPVERARAGRGVERGDDRHADDHEEHDAERLLHGTSGHPRPRLATVATRHTP